MGERNGNREKSMAHKCIIPNVVESSALFYSIYNKYE